MLYSAYIDRKHSVLFNMTMPRSPLIPVWWRSTRSFRNAPVVTAPGSIAVGCYIPCVLVISIIIIWHLLCIICWVAPRCCLRCIPAWEQPHRHLFSSSSSCRGSSSSCRAVVNDMNNCVDESSNATYTTQRQRVEVGYTFPRCQPARLAQLHLGCTALAARAPPQRAPLLPCCFYSCMDAVSTQICTVCICDFHRVCSEAFIAVPFTW